MLTIYYVFAGLRQTELIEELTEKAQTTARLLIQVKEIDYDMQKIIDKNSFNKLYYEKAQIYNANKKLIYSSTDTPTIQWTNAEFGRLKKDRQVFKKEDQYVVLGLYNIIDNEPYYILISADKTYDNSKLTSLKYILLIVFVAGTIVVWVLSFSLSKKALEPLDNFRKNIQEITDSNLKIRLATAGGEDEINALAGSFNQMMDRIDNAYNRQKEFTGNASHELRTPVARITAQLENLLHREGVDLQIKANLKSIFDDAFKLSDVISSLVLLADINNREHNFSFEKLRLDELVFSTAAALVKIYPDFKLKFEIENTTSKETELEISGDETLLKIALLNLFKNAYIYSDNQLFECLIRQQEQQIQLFITNTGSTPEVDDTATLFTTFTRGSNAAQTQGSGVGLSIVKRVLDYHKSQVVFNIIDKNTNQLIVTFPV
ncbi:HAMP domain-containing sensor histidine kinase [Mucilaginibacter puniceus]